MRYYHEEQQLRQQMKQQKQQQLLIQQKQQVMMKSITQIQCRLLRHCRNKEKRCIMCSKNQYRNKNYPPVDYFDPIVPGLTVMP
jgi:hypothetical protein